LKPLEAFAAKCPAVAAVYAAKYAARKAKAGRRFQVPRLLEKTRLLITGGGIGLLAETPDNRDSLQQIG
jgi:hypothetical protein